MATAAVVAAMVRAAWNLGPQSTQKVSAALGRAADVLTPPLRLQTCWTALWWWLPAGPDHGVRAACVRRACGLCAACVRRTWGVHFHGTLVMTACCSHLVVAVLGCEAKSALRVDGVPSWECDHRRVCAWVYTRRVFPMCAAAHVCARACVRCALRRERPPVALHFSPCLFCLNFGRVCPCVRHCDAEHVRADGVAAVLWACNRPPTTLLHQQCTLPAQAPAPPRRQQPVLTEEAGAAGAAGAARRRRRAGKPLTWRGP